MGKIIFFGNQKGGVGKTTLTALTAGALGSPPFSRRIFAADLDQQQSLIRARLADLRDFGGIPPYKCEAMTLAELLSEIERLDRDFDFILIDAPGKLDAHLAADQQEIAKLLLVADFVFIPVVAGNYGLDATLDFIKLAYKIAARRTDRPLEIAALVNMAEPQTIDGRALDEELAEIRAMIPTIRAVKTPLRRFAAFRAINTLESLYNDKSADKARQNFRDWIEEIFAIIDKDK